MIVKKKEPGDIRIFLDLTVLNTHAPLIHLMVERMEDILLKVGGNVCSLSLDLVSSFL